MPVLSAIFVFAVITVIAVENKAQLKCYFDGKFKKYVVMLWKIKASYTLGFA